MALVMTKYRYNDNNYLIYERTILDKNFTSTQWATICDDIEGISADFIVEIINTQVVVYNAKGQKIDINKATKDIIAHHNKQNTILSSKLTRTIEIRFTDKYINNLCTHLISNKHIA